MSESNIEQLYQGLLFLRNRQRPALERLGEDPGSKETARTYGLALAIEVAEFVNETNWKSWKDKEPDRERVLDEFSDVLHFIGTWVNILESMGISAEDIAVSFEVKQRVNQARLNGEIEHYGAGYRRPDQEGQYEMNQSWPGPYGNGDGSTQLSFDNNGK